MLSKRIIGTFEFEGLPEGGDVSLEATTFDELPKRRTMLIVKDVFLSLEERDGMCQSGIEEGIIGSYD